MYVYRVVQSEKQCKLIEAESCARVLQNKEQAEYYVSPTQNMHAIFPNPTWLDNRGFSCDMDKLESELCFFF